MNCNITSVLLGMLQKFTSIVLFATGIFVWFTDNENREKNIVYRKLRFHPAYSSCYSLSTNFRPQLFMQSTILIVPNFF